MLRTAALGSALVAALAAGVLLGGSPLPPLAVLAALGHPHGSSEAATIVWTLRVPRVAIAAFVGATLAVSGFLLQGMLRNPLADPFLTGVSAGAGAAIAIAVAAGLAAAALPAVGFAAALATAALVGALARRGGGVDVERLILSGVALSALFSAIVTMVLLAVSRESSATIIAFLAGSVAGRGWGDLAAAAPYALAGLACAAAAAPALDALRLGPDAARSVGVDLARVQWIVLAGSSLLAAAAVAVSGIVGFVGLVVPHVARRLVGTSATRALPACAALGAALAVVADAVARSVAAPAEIPLGVVLAFVGVPAFLYLYLRPAGGTRLWGA